MTRSRAIFLLCIVNIAGGASYVATDYALECFSPLATVLWRTLLGLIFLALLSARSLALCLHFSDWLRIAAIGVFGYAVPVFLGTLGQKYSSPINASLLIGVEPVFIILLAVLFLREALTIKKIISIALGITGAGLIVLQNFPLTKTPVMAHWKGDVILILHGAFWAIYTVMGKPLLKTVPPLPLTTWVTFAGLAALIPASLAAGEPLWPPSVTASAWAGILFLAVVVNCLVTWGWNKALENVSASMLANFIFLQPLAGVILSAALGRGAVNSWGITGGFLILAGAYLASRQET
ncbi:MAG: EamA family transporter [Elusimicrobia bacterium]|nr:EamA family transporter [Elusimicrobiota bacterium]